MYSQFIAKTHEVMQKANEIFGLDIKLEVTVDIRGTRCAGQAVRKWGTYRVRLNPLFCQQHPEDMMNDTIPHEVAHIVCFALKICDGHGKNWKGVAKKLGCSGETYTKLSVIDPNKTCYYAVFGENKVEIGAKRYNDVMKGLKKYRCKFGQINKETQFEIVKGNTIQAVKKEAAEVSKKAKEISTTAKQLPKPAKASAALYDSVNGDFEKFAMMLEGKTAQYIKDQFKRAAFHA